MSNPPKVAEIIVESLCNAGVKYVFGIPGAKVDALFNTLLDHPKIKLIVCRHEQNAAFMAAAIGRITGIPGVCCATSGPGAGNLTTGLVTATTEGDPVVAIIGSVPRAMSVKHTHQSMKALDILAHTAKSTADIEVEDQAAEMILSSFRTANTSPKGAAVLQLPIDIAAGTSKIIAFPPEPFRPPLSGPAPTTAIQSVARLIENAKLPVFFLGQRAGNAQVVSAIRAFIKKVPVAVVETFQAAGAVPQDLADRVFFGRVGLFRNQVGDRLLAASDLIVTFGYDPAEYDASAWNPRGAAKIVHVDSVRCAYDACYKPITELIGFIPENVHGLAQSVSHAVDPASSDVCNKLLGELNAWNNDLDIGKGDSDLIQPLHFVSALQKRVSKDTTVTCDIGTVYIYMMRYFKAYEARHFLCSNGQQTLGVSMPWAIAASLAQDPPCSRKVISVSGDGGFMFSCQELSTAVQQGCDITHFVWNSGTYNMVEFQEEAKYGRSSGIEIGGVNFVKLVEAFDGKGFKVNRPDELESVMDAALKHKGFALVELNIDYSHSGDLMTNLIRDSVA